MIILATWFWLESRIFFPKSASIKIKIYTQDSYNNNLLLFCYVMHGATKSLKCTTSVDLFPPTSCTLIFESDACGVPTKAGADGTRKFVCVHNIKVLCFIFWFQLLNLVLLHLSQQSIIYFTNYLSDTLKKVFFFSFSAEFSCRFFFFTIMPVYLMKI